MAGTRIRLLCGVDWWMQFSAVDDDGDAVTLTSPKMEIRAKTILGATSQGALLYTSEGDDAAITFTTPETGTAVASIAGSATANLASGQVGVWQAVATDPDGQVIELGSGDFVSVPNVVEL